MNILRLSTLSLSLAIAIFALGYVNPSFAAPPDKCSPWPSCKNDNGDGDFDTVFLVEMQPGTVGAADGLVTSNSVACGTTVAEPGHKELDAFFPDGCVTVDVCFITPPTGCPLTLNLFGFDVRDNRSEAEASLFFYDETGNGYIIQISGGEPPVKIIRNGSITVTVNRSGLYLIKVHQPRKGDLVGPIAIGEIVYNTPIE